MGIFLSQDNLTKVIELPVMPGSISFTTGSDNKTYDLINIGKAKFLSGNPLQKISINSWFPGPGQKTGLTNFQQVEDPLFYIDAVNEIKNNKKPVRLTITEIGLTIMVSIEAFDYEINGGDDEYIYSMNFDEFREITIAEITTIEVELNELETASIVTTDRPNDKLVPVQVTVIQNDTLWKISKKELGDGSRYPEIAELNNIKAPFTIFPGQVVLIPND